MHDSYDCDRLCLSDIFAGVPASAYLLCDTPKITGTNDAMDVSARVFTHNDTPIKGFSVEFSAGGETLRNDYPDVTLSPGEMYPVVFPEALIPRENESVEYSLSVIADGDVYSQTSTLTSLPVRVMCEEMTGTWCGFCVCGIVELEKMRLDYPETFICAAVHINDPSNGCIELKGAAGEEIRLYSSSGLLLGVSRTGRLDITGRHGVFFAVAGTCTLKVIL